MHTFSLHKSAPNHALQRTAPALTLATSAAAFPSTMQPARQPPPSLSLGSLGIARRTVKTALLALAVLAHVFHSAFASPRVNLTGLSDSQFLALLEKQVTAHPKDPKALFELADFQATLRQSGAARATIDRLIPILPDDPALLCQVGNLLLFLGSTDACITQYERALRICPTSADTHFNLATIYAVMQPPKLALAKLHYSRALALGSEPDAALEKLIK